MLQPALKLLLGFCSDFVKPQIPLTSDYPGKEMDVTPEDKIVNRHILTENELRLLLLCIIEVLRAKLEHALDVSCQRIFSPAIAASKHKLPRFKFNSEKQGRLKSDHCNPKKVHGTSIELLVG